MVSIINEFGEQKRDFVLFVTEVLESIIKCVLIENKFIILFILYLFR